MHVYPKVLVDTLGARRARRSSSPTARSSCPCASRRTRTDSRRGSHSDDGFWLATIKIDKRKSTNYNNKKNELNGCIRRSSLSLMLLWWCLWWLCCVLCQRMALSRTCHHVDALGEFEARLRGALVHLVLAVLARVAALSLVHVVEIERNPPSPFWHTPTN